MSYAALFQNQNARYRSIGGQINPAQPKLIQAAVEDLPLGSTVIAAMDSDDVGRKLATMVAYANGFAGRPDIVFRAHLPTVEGEDWNDRLRSSKPSPLPIAQGLKLDVPKT